MARKRKHSKRAKAAAKKMRISPDDIKLEQPYHSDATLLSLVDDCFFAIFNRLKLSDLYAIGQTCKHLRQVSSDYFAHRHKSKVLIIENVSATGRLIKGPKGEEYIDVFTTSLQNVTLGIKLASKAVLERLATFYTTNEMAPIKSLRFDGWVTGLMEEHGRVIAAMADEVESFTLSNSAVVGDLNECILQHLPNMSRLTLWEKNNLNEGMSYQWLEKSYPKLQHFAWHTDDELPINLVRYFLRINPDIRFFSLQSRSRFQLRQLIEQNIRVSELFFTVTGNPNIFADLQNLCAQQGTRLHLKFPDGASRKVLAQNMTQFAQLAQYTDGLYFENHGISDNLARTVTTFNNLKVLQHNIATGVPAHMLANIPTLQVIYAYWSVMAQNFEEYRTVMMLYAMRLPNLKRLYMRNNSQKFRKFKFEEFDAARKQLAGACKLKIHFRTDELFYMGALNDIRREYDIINIERVESEEIKNPLVTEFLIANKLKESGDGNISW